MTFLVIKQPLLGPLRKGCLGIGGCLIRNLYKTATKQIGRIFSSSEQDFRYFSKGGCGIVSKYLYG